MGWVQRDGLKVVVEKRKIGEWSVWYPGRAYWKMRQHSGVR